MKWLTALSRNRGSTEDMDNILRYEEKARSNSAQASSRRLIFEEIAARSATGGSSQVSVRESAHPLQNRARPSLSFPTRDRVLRACAPDRQSHACRSVLRAGA